MKKVHLRKAVALAAAAVTLVIGAFYGQTAVAESDSIAWPSFRGPDSQGIGTGETVTTWNGETGDHVLWKAQIPGLGHASPVVAGDRIFLTTAVPVDGAPQELKLGLYGDIAPVTGEGAQRWLVIALDRGTGELLWQKVAHEGEAAIKRHTKATHANSTPAVDEERVVAFFGSEGLHAYSHAGEHLWSRDFGVLDSGFFRAPTAQWGFASSPILHDGRVILQVDTQGDSFVAALDAATGETLWRTARDEVPTWSTPAVMPWTGGEEEKQQVVVNGWKHIGGYDLETGKELWRLEGGGDIPVPTPLYSESQGAVIITSAHGAERPIYAVSTSAAGTLSTESEAMLRHQERAGTYMQTPLLFGDLGFFCLDNGVLSVYALEDGERKSQQRLGGGKTGFTASPVASSEHLYFTSEDGDTTVLTIAPEPQVVATNELGETVMASPALVDGVLYIRGREHLFAIGSNSTP